MAEIKGILFDLGDTLVDFGPVDMRRLFVRGSRLAYRYLQEMGHSLPPFRTYHRRQLWSVQWHYLKSRIIRREFNALDVLVATGRNMGYGLTDAESEELAWRFYRPMAECASVEGCAVDMLAGFQAEGLSLGVVSNTFVPGEALDRHLAEAGLLEYLPTRVYSCNVRFRKPDPRIFQLALDQASLAAAETLFVGDSFPADVLGAQQVGMIAVLKDPSGARRHRRIRPDHRIASLRDLPRIVAGYNRG